jgi:hypothetical protein
LRGGAAISICARQRSIFWQRTIGFNAVLPVMFVRYHDGRSIKEDGRSIKERGQDWEARGMAININNLTFDPDVSDLITTAFDKSWQFVRTDPELAHNDMNEMRARLSRHITRMANSGERDLWRLANSAIGQLRRERSAA